MVDVAKAKVCRTCAGKGKFRQPVKGGQVRVAVCPTCRGTGKDEILTK